LHRRKDGLTLRERLGRLLVVPLLLISGVAAPAPVVTATAGTAVVAVATAGVVVATPDSAEANIPDGYRNFQWGNAVGYAVWDETYTANNYDYVYESVTPTTFDNNQFCLTTMFDWTRDAPEEEDNHYDARVAQSCVVNGFQDIYPIYESVGANLLGVQKLGQCLGYAFAESQGVCQDQPNMDFSVHTISSNVWATTWWTYYRDGRHTYDTGGDPTDPYA
jgi:hypothetical protein